MYKEIEIINGKHKLVYQNRILLASEEPLLIKMALDEGFQLHLKFSFEKKEQQKAFVKFEHMDVPNGLGCHFILTNFNNPIGNGLITPKPIITHHVGGKEKQVCITFYVFKHADGNPIIDINLYEEI